jgi:hypothetical protein
MHDLAITLHTDMDGHVHIHTCMRISRRSEESGGVAHPQRPPPTKCFTETLPLIGAGAEEPAPGSALPPPPASMLASRSRVCVCVCVCVCVGVGGVVGWMCQRHAERQTAAQRRTRWWMTSAVVGTGRGQGGRGRGMRLRDLVWRGYSTVGQRLAGCFLGLSVLLVLLPSWRVNECCSLAGDAATAAHTSSVKAGLSLTACHPSSSATSAVTDARNSSTAIMWSLFCAR